MCQNKWDEYFMSVAELTAKLSKDPRTKVGACIAKDKKVLSIGYNGAPRKFPDELVPQGDIDCELINQKNSYMVHAELNAILNYKGSLSELQGATLYVTVSPCNACALALAQAGITTIIYKEKYHRQNITKLTEYIFDKCGINMYSMNEIFNNKETV